MSSGDSSNIVTRLAKKFEVPLVVARIYDPRRAESTSGWGSRRWPPTEWTADQVMQVLIPDQVASDWRGPTPDRLITLVLPDEWAGWRYRPAGGRGHRQVVQGDPHRARPDRQAPDDAAGGRPGALAVDENGLQELRPRVLAAHQARPRTSPPRRRKPTGEGGHRRGGQRPASSSPPTCAAPVRVTMIEKDLHVLEVATGRRRPSGSRSTPARSCRWSWPGSPTPT